MPDTMCVSNASRSVLHRSIVNKFPELQVTPISRIHFNDANGLERVKTLCAAEYSSVELFVKEKYRKQGLSLTTRSFDHRSIFFDRSTSR